MIVLVLDYDRFVYMYISRNAYECFIVKYLDNNYEL
jgi:hypothetical protein